MEFSGCQFKRNNRIHYLFIQCLMKENKLIEMWNRIEILGANQQQIISETQNLKDLLIGTLETLKRTPGYEEALEKLKADTIKDSDNKEKLENVE